MRFQTLVSTRWLHKQLTSQGSIHANSLLRILDASCGNKPDVDGYNKYYLKYHIPQASYFDLHKLCPKSKSSLDKFPVPDANRFQDYVESLGVSSDTHVVAYDGLKTMFALKTWWLFKLFGHDNVSVLDGGIKKWFLDRYKFSSEEPKVKRGSFKAEFCPELLCSFEDMVDNLKTKERQVVDARSPAIFNNIIHKMPQERMGYGGHIPGAINIPYSSLFQMDGIFKPAAELEELFTSAGVDLEKPMVAMCHGALSASGLAAAAHIVTEKDVAVYNGSFREWVKRADSDDIED